MKTKRLSRSQSRKRLQRTLGLEFLENRWMLADDPDDQLLEATAFGQVSTTARSFDAAITPDTDVDMYSFSVAPGQVVDFDIDTTQNGPGGLGSVLRIFDGQGQQLAFNNDANAPGENTIGYDAYLRYTFNANGQFYVGVSNANNQFYNPVTGNGDVAGGNNATGSYKLTVQLMPDDTNDSLIEAIQVGSLTTTPTTLSGTIFPDIDVNIYSFSVSPGSVVDFDIDTALNGPGGLGSYLRLFDAQGQQLAFNNDAAAPGENLAGFDAYLRYTFTTGGNFFLGVSNANNSLYNPVTGNGDTAGGFHSIGDYQLIMQVVPPVVEDADDAINEANSLGAITTTPSTFSNSISPDTDVDMIRFTVTAGQVVDFDIDTVQNGAGGLGSFLRLFDSQGQQLAFNNDGMAPGENVIGFDAYLRYTFTVTGTYYIAVSNANNTLYNPNSGNGDTSGGLHSTGDYQLIVQALPVDNDDTTISAVSLGAITSNPSTTSSRISPDIDVDMYSFSVGTGQTVDFDIDTPLNGGGGLGSFLRLFNGQGQQIAFNNDAAAPGENVVGYDAYIRYTFTAGGIYYLGVSNANNTLYNPTTGLGDTAGGANSVGDYQLIVQLITLAPDDTDDALNEATAVGALSTTPASFNSSISPDTDVDMYRFTVTAGQLVDFDIDTTLNGQGGLGSYIRLFDSQGQQLAANNDGAAPGENTIGFDAYLRYGFANSGTYYLGVSNANNTLYNSITGGGDASGGQNATGDYRLTFEVMPADTNDSISEAISLGQLTTSPTTISGTISPDFDVDLYSFTAAANQTIDFDIDTALNGIPGLSSYVTLFNSQGQAIGSNNDAAAPGESTVGFDAYLRHTFASAGTYYIGISNSNNISYNLVTGDGDTSGGSYSIGDYQLVVQIISVSSGDTDDAMDESISLGTLTSSPKTFSDSISPDTDVDLYRFDATANQVIDFDIDTVLNGVGGLGSYLRLFDSLGQQIAFNNDGAAPGETSVGFDAYLRHTFATSGTYYLGVSNANNTLYNPSNGSGDIAGGLHATGSYQLIVQVVTGDSDDAISEVTSLGAVTTTPITVSGSISPDTDVDMIRFSVTAGLVVDFDIDTVLNGAGGLGSYIRLFNDQGVQLAANNDAIAPGDSKLGFDAYLRYTFTSAGTYYLGVSNANNIDYDPVSGNGDTAGGLHATGNYDLILQALPIDTDDTRSEATPLGTLSSSPTLMSSSIVTDIDVDMYSFSVTAGQTVDFDIDTVTNGPGGLDAFLWLFDSQGQQVVFNNNAAAPGESNVVFDSYIRHTFTTAGTYFVSVSNANNTQYDPTTGNNDTAGGLHSIGNYQLIVQLVTGTQEDTDDTLNEAPLLGTLSTTPITVNANISPDIDVDMVRFVVTAGQVVDFDIDTVQNGTGGLQSYLRLFNGSGQQIDFNNDAAAPGESTVGFDAYLRYTFTTAGTYYLGVSNSNNTQYNATTGAGDTAGGSNTTGSYQLIVQLVQASTGDTDDTLTEANLLGALTTTPTTVNATISPDIDVDMYRFNVSAGQVIDFDIDTATNGGTGLGSYLRLFDSSGQQIAFNNDAAAPGESQTGMDAYLRYTFTTAGSYYLGVSNANNIQYSATTGNGDTAGGANATGDYQLNVQVVVVQVGDNDDALSEASSLGALSTTPATVNGAISPDTDVDMFTFTVTAGQTIDFDVDTATNGGAGLGSFLRLFSEQGTQIGSAGAAAAPGENSVGIDAYFRFTFASGGTYFLGVSNANNQQYDAATGNGDTAGGLNATGDYQLIVQSVSSSQEDTDDTLAESRLIGPLSTSPTTISGSIAPDIDVDMVRFSVTAGQVIDFDIDTDTNGPPGLQSFIRLFDAQGQQLAFNNDAAAPGEGTTGSDAYLRYTFAVAGTFYLGISNANNSLYNPISGAGDTAGGLQPTGNYQLVVQVVPQTSDDSDDAISEGLSLGTLSTNPTVINGSISPDTDVDMYRLTVSAGQIVDFDIDTAANGSGGLGSFLRLFDGQGLQLAFNNDAAAPGESTVGFDAYLRFTFSNAGTYFIGVSNSNNIQYNPLTGGGDASGGPNSTGSYQLSVQLISTGPEDPDDSIGDALLLGALTTTAVSVSGSISPDTDVDMYRFTLADAVTVDFDIDTTFSAASLGSYIRIFDAQGQQLAFNNDGTAPGESNAGFDSYLRYSFASPGTYYIGVSNAVNILYNPITGGDDIAGGTRSTGDYSLFAQVVLVAAQDPDDSLSESTTIGPISSSPTSVSGDVSPATDVDLYRFVVSAGQTIDFDVDTLTNGGSGLGSYLRLFNGQGQQLAFNDNGAAPGESQTGIDAYLRYTFTAAGTFYLGISNGNNTQYNPVDGSGDTDGGSNSTGNYTLVVQLIPAGGDLDDTLSEAAVIGGLSTNPTILNASISPDIDVDMFQFAASIGQTLEFDIDTALNGPGGLSSFLRLFDANGQQIGFGGPASAPGEGQANFDAFLRHTFSASGTYYIGVSNGNNTLYDPLSGTGDTAGGANATGNYSLIVQVSSVVEGDPDDTLTEALVLGAVGPNPINLNGTISTDIDVDLVQFTVLAGQVVDFDIDTTQNGTGGLASYIRLLDAQGQQIAFNDNARAPGESTLGSDAYLRYTFTAAGTYYLGISNATNFQYNPINGDGDIGGGVDATGSYQLTVTALPASLSILSSVFSIPERNGEAIVQVVRTNTSLASAVTVQLSSSNTQVATVPASVVIPAGQSFAAFRITAVDNLIVDGSKSVTITAAAAGLLSTSVQLTVTDSNGLWHNAASPFDVSNDGNISPLDVLVVLNYLNTNGTGSIPQGAPGPYYDVNSDNFISPIDALLVINYLNLRLGGGEGESTLFADPLPLFESADFDLEIASETAATIQSIDDYFADLGRRRK